MPAALVMLPTSPSVYVEGSLCCLSQAVHPPHTTGILGCVTLWSKGPPLKAQQQPHTQLTALDVFIIIISFHLWGEAPVYMCSFACLEARGEQPIVLPYLIP